MAARRSAGISRLGSAGEDGPDGGNNQLIVQPRYPIGTDPLAIRRLLELEADRREAPAKPTRDRRARFDHALGVEAQGFRRAYCVLPEPATKLGGRPLLRPPNSYQASGCQQRK